MQYFQPIVPFDRTPVQSFVHLSGYQSLFAMVFTEEIIYDKTRHGKQQQNENPRQRLYRIAVFRYNYNNNADYSY